MKKTRCTTIANEALQPLIDKAADDRSFPARLAEAMTENMGEKFHRQEVDLWLCPNAKQRIEPRLGAGMLLIKLGKRIIAKDLKG